jgi:hypothetical protein
MVDMKPPLDKMDYFVEKHSAKAGKWLGRRIYTAANSFLHLSFEPGNGFGG